MQVYLRYASLFLHILAVEALCARLLRDSCFANYTRGPDERSWAMVSVAEGKDQVVDRSKLSAAYVIPF